MSGELAKVYNPKDVEKKIYQMWLEAGAFDAEASDPRRTFCIVIPPPNVTDVLHLGHALNNSLQDVIVRYKRMCQLNTLWMPGTDHAGIATQTVVEKRLLSEEGRRRTDFSREEFVARVQKWKDQYEARILEQLKLMGCSCDWRRTRFTMDEVCARAVREAFFRLFADGVIYRGKRLVNWDPATQTVLADDEVEHETVHGHFWYLRYPLVEPVEIDGRTVEYVTVATTRPETMLGDTAVAINPADPRAKALVGREVRLPIVGRIIPIIADDLVVLPNPDSQDEKARFSTGFLKVTPAHDPNDWEIGQRHGLPVINVMAPDGTISDKYGWDDAKGTDAEQLLGMDRFEARQAVVEWFRSENLLADVRQYVHEVGHSYRSHVPIEPYLSDQWYIAVKQPIDRLAGQFGTGLIEGTDVPVNSLAGLALKPLLDGRLRFTPERYAKTYQSWLENLRDWPISRQLWWGHRIPLWYIHLDVSSIDYGKRPVQEVQREYFSAFQAEFRKFTEQAEISDGVRLKWSLEEPSVAYLCTKDSKADTFMESLQAEVGRSRKDAPGGMGKYIERVDRDPDVLDTWFSSALWPFSTLGWPADSEDLRRYYPGDVLCTAREIITLWVSRMVMMGQYCLGDIPFSDVFIHAMIQDGEGRKMSKSLGNGIDPLEIIDSHGADAMRFTLVAMTTQTQDVRMPVTELTLPDGRKANTSSKFDMGRNFCNKLWNASRFAMMNLQGQPAWRDVHPSGDPAGAWILSRLNTTVREATRALEAYRFNELAEKLYHFLWDDFCDWYLEIAKARINAGQDGPKAILSHCLDVLLRLLHPIMPFITEAIWQRLNEVAPVRGPGDEPAEPLLARARWPQADAAVISPALEERFGVIQDIVRQIRNVRTQHHVPPGKKVPASAEADAAMAELLEANVDLLKSLADLDEVAIHRRAISPPPGSAAVTAGGIKLYVLDIIDRDAEIKRLEKQAETLRRGIAGIEAKLGNEQFLAKAPPEVVQRERRRLEALRTDLQAVRKSLESLG